MCGIVSYISQRIGILRLVKRIFVDTSMLLHCYFAFVLPIVEYYSPAWGYAADCHIQLLERHVHSVDRLFSRSVYLVVVIDVVWLGLICCTRLKNLNSNHCLFSELPSASTRAG